jgi:hypothetical protein
MEAFQIVNRLMSINGSALSNVQFLKVTISLVRNLAWSDRRIGDFSGRRSDRSSIAVATTELGGCPGVTVNSRLPTGPIGHAPGASGKHLIRRFPYGYSRSFRSVRDLGSASFGCALKSGEPESRSSVWLPAWLPAGGCHACAFCGALVLPAPFPPSLTAVSGAWPT